MNNPDPDTILGEPTAARRDRDGEHVAGPRLYGSQARDAAGPNAAQALRTGGRGFSRTSPLRYKDLASGQGLVAAEAAPTSDSDPLLMPVDPQPPTRAIGRISWGLRIINLLLIGLLLILDAPHMVEAAGHPTIVSLTFDDGLMQSAAIQALLDSGLKATFYVNSNLIRTSGHSDNNDFLTKRELDTLFYYGYDIGGHTIDHVDLTTLSDAAQRRAICDDLKTLRNWYGDKVYSFAYPFASIGLDTREIVATGCPGTYGPAHKPIGKYESARNVGQSGDCPHCGPEEALKPPDRYDLYSNESVIATDSLATLQDRVTQAEAHGGGWVTMVFHKICDACDLYSVKQETLVRFLAWLKARAAHGTYVRTVHQVIAGDYPGSPTSPLTPKLPLTTGLGIGPSHGLPMIAADPFRQD